MNYTEADVERLIDEYRAEQAAVSAKSENEMLSGELKSWTQPPVCAP